MCRAVALLVSIALSGCVSEIDAPAGNGGPGDPDDPDHRDDGRPDLQASPEECNHYDDDLDGLVDDGCTCIEGQTQWCWLGAPGVEGEGTCAAGVQWCDTSQVEFPEWGPCEEAVLPANDVCGDGLDQDCDGADRVCREPDLGDPEDQDQDFDQDQDQDQDLDLDQDQDQDQDLDQAENPAVVEVDLFLIGDCVTATCPDDAPYPVGCNVIFTPGDDRGCVASQPDDSTVYFQAGDECDRGLVMGTLLCSAVQGDPLDEGSCPINKPVPIYAQDRDGCPETH